MQTIIAIFLFFLIFVLLVYGYYKYKKDRLEKLQNGICPRCGARKKSFFDKVNKINIQVNPIQSKILKHNSCSGAIEIKYSCNSCALEEIHMISSSCGCSI